MIKTGGRRESPDRAGLADVTAHMPTRGRRPAARSRSRSRPPSSARRCRRQHLGFVDVSLSTLSRNLDGALAMFADVVTNPSFTPTVRAGARQPAHRDDPPQGQPADGREPGVHALLYGESHPYGWPMAGVESSIKKLTPPTCAAPTTSIPAQQRGAAGRGRHDREGAARQAGCGVRRSGARRAPPPRSCLRPRARRGDRIFLIDKADARSRRFGVGLMGIDRKSPDYFLLRR